MTAWRGVHVLGLFTLTAVAGCGQTESAGGADSIEIDGSSTVFPITEAVAEEFMAETGGRIRVTVAYSGTGGGFRRFCAGEIDIAGASRPIVPEEEAACAAAGVEFLEVPVAFDGLSVVVHPANDFVDCLTVDELRRIWEPGSTVQSWSRLRADWPDQPIRLYGPGTNSGTFDYFTEVINGESGASRADYTASEDDNVLVQGVAGDPNALGYFGYAYFAENESRLKVVGVDAGNGCTLPDPRTIETGAYSPLSRPLMIYVNRAALREPAVREFMSFYLDSAALLSEAVGYVPLGADRYEDARVELARIADAG